MVSRTSSGPSGIPALPRSPILASPDAALAGGLQSSPLARRPSTWMRFNWQTGNLSTFALIPATDLIRPATHEEAEQVLQVLLLSLAMDSGWNDSVAKVEEYLKNSVKRLFNADEPLCLVIPKGNRLIAASLLDPDAGSPCQLVSGPSVLMEYRNRGIGSRLLHESLLALRDRGLSSVSGFTKPNSVASRHVYPKFGGIGETCEFSLVTALQREAKS